MARHKFRAKAGVNDKHHLIPVSRGGQTNPHNLLLLDAYRHLAWHLLFGDKTLAEVIDLLTRLKHIKESKRFRKLIK